MKAKLYQITPYNINDNNFYNFTSQLKFNQFLDQIEKSIQKDVSIVKLEAYNKIMYKLKFENESEEKIFCGFKYMIVDNKYWFITNFEIKKNNNSGFITYYAQLDHWATQWLTVKKHIHNNIQEKSLYVERMHQTRFTLNLRYKKINYDNIDLIKFINESELETIIIFNNINCYKKVKKNLWYNFVINNLNNFENIINNLNNSDSINSFDNDFIENLVKIFVDSRNNNKSMIWDLKIMKKTFYLYINFSNNSPFHNEEKIKINSYIPNKSFELINVDNNKNDFPTKNINKCYYYLRFQLNKPYVTNHVSYSFIFIPLTDKNMNYYLKNFNPNFMKLFAVLDKKIFNYKIISNFENLIDYTNYGGFKLKSDEDFIDDNTFYQKMSDNISTLYDEIEIEKIPYNFFSENYSYYKDIKNELILLTYPYTKYIFSKGNNFKEYKINELLYNDKKIKMNYFSFISYNIYNLWIFPTSGMFQEKDYRSNLHHALSLQNNLEIPTTSNSYTTYAQNNLNTLQTNINQAETARQIANQEATVGLVTSAITTALGVALAPVTMGASLGLAGAGAAYMGVQTNKWINTQIKNNFEVDSLNAKISDMKNTPNLISAVNNDYYWLTFFNNGGYFNEKDLDKSVSRFYVSTINDFDKKILFDWYYYNGYLFNRYTNDLNFDEKRNRYILNFYKIKELKTILATCLEICNEDIEWWNNTFQQGIIIWETEDPLHLYNEQIYIGNNKYENWEIELLNKNYILQEIKADKIKQEKIKQDQRAAKLLSNIVKEQKGGN